MGRCFPPFLVFAIVWLYLIPGGFHVNRSKNSKSSVQPLDLGDRLITFALSRPLSEMESVKTDVSVAQSVFSSYNAGRLSRLLPYLWPVPRYKIASDKCAGRHLYPSAGLIARLRPTYDLLPCTCRSRPCLYSFGGLAIMNQ